MSLLQNLENVSRREQKDFLESFDHVLCDMDGVLWIHFSAFFVGVTTFKKYITQLGKSFAVITANTLARADYLKSLLISMGFDDNFDVINDTVVISEYLKSLNFNKEIFVIGSDSVKEELKHNGFTVATDPKLLPDTMFDDIVMDVQDDPNIGAVVCSVEWNINRLKIQKAINCLCRKDCIFIIGAAEKYFPTVGSKLEPIIGNTDFYNLICEVAERDYLQMGKPSKTFAEYVQKRCNIKNPKRTLFIGDSVTSDMQFAATAGYQKLLVLSGNTKLADIVDWKYSEEAKPQYYVQDLNTLKNIISNTYGFEQ